MFHKTTGTWRRAVVIPKPLSTVILPVNDMPETGKICPSPSSGGVPIQLDEPRGWQR